MNQEQKQSTRFYQNTAAAPTNTRTPYTLTEVLCTYHCIALSIYLSIAALCRGMQADRERIERNRLAALEKRRRAEALKQSLNLKFSLPPFPTPSPPWQNNYQRAPSTAINTTSLTWSKPFQHPSFLYNALSMQSPGGAFAQHPTFPAPPQQHLFPPHPQPPPPGVNTSGYNFPFYPVTTDQHQASSYISQPQHSEYPPHQEFSSHENLPTKSDFSFNSASLPKKLSTQKIKKLHLPKDKKQPRKSPSIRALHKNNIEAEIDASSGAVPKFCITPFDENNPPPKKLSQSTLVATMKRYRANHMHKPSIIEDDINVQQEDNGGEQSGTRHGEEAHGTVDDQNECAIHERNHSLENEEPTDVPALLAATRTTTATTTTATSFFEGAAVSFGAALTNTTTTTTTKATIPRIPIPSLISNNNNIINNRRWSWLADRRDVNGRQPHDPGYDPRTLFIPLFAFDQLQGFNRQYWKIKKEYMDVVLFVRVGSFYELYDTDADIGMRIGLNPMGINSPTEDHQHGNGVNNHHANMWKVGCHAKSFAHWASLVLAQGYPVGRVEEVRGQKDPDPRCSKILTRTLQQLYTPGTALTLSQGYGMQSMESMSTQNDPLLSFVALYEGTHGLFGACVVDVSSATFSLVHWQEADVQRSMLCTLLTQTNPSEVLVISPQSLTLDTRNAIKKYRPLVKDGIDRPLAVTMLHSRLSHDLQHSEHCPCHIITETESQSNTLRVSSWLDSFVSLPTRTARGRNIISTKTVSLLHNSATSRDGGNGKSRHPLVQATIDAYCGLGGDVHALTSIISAHEEEYTGEGEHSVAAYAGEGEHLVAARSSTGSSHPAHIFAIAAFQMGIMHLHHTKIAQHIIPHATITALQSFTRHGAQASGTMLLDATAIRSLEILQNSFGQAKGSLLDFLSKGAVTLAGRRCIRSWVCCPLYRIGDITERLDTVSLFMHAPEVVGEFQGMLKMAPDCQRLLPRVATLMEGISRSCMEKHELDEEGGLSDDESGGNGMDDRINFLPVVQLFEGLGMCVQNSS